VRPSSTAERAIGSERGGSLGADPAAVDDRDLPRQAVGLLQVLGGEQNGHPVARQLGDDPPELLARARVKAGGRLVEQHDRRTADQSRREVEAPVHAARVDGRAAVGRIGELKALEQGGQDADEGGLPRAIFSTVGDDC
jgi:hypothetical protein